IGPATPPSDGPLGVEPFGVQVHNATADLSHVVYTSKALWPIDESGNTQIGSLYEYTPASNQAPVLVGVSGEGHSNDQISRCSTLLGGTGNFTVSSYGSLSADGDIVYFTAVTCPGGTGSNENIPVLADTLYARIDETHTVEVSERSPTECTGACLTSIPADAKFEGASVDGSKVFFTSTQQLIDSAGQDPQSRDTAFSNGCGSTTGSNGCNLYEYDFANPAGHNLIDVSAGDKSGSGPRVAGVVAISPDGSHVYFVAKGTLTAAANNVGESARVGADNMYVFERDAAHPEGRVAFVAALTGLDGEVWERGGDANVTPDGHFLVFTSHGKLTSDDTRSDGAQQVFRYDAQSGELARISVGELGFNDNGNAGIGDASIVLSEKFFFRAGPKRADPTMSNDGSYVFFQSPVGLTPQALNDVQIGINHVAEGFNQPQYAQNVYEYHAGHVSLISDGVDTSRYGLGQSSSVELIGSDATGANVFFTTADQLVPQDTDTQRDYYDARICTSAEPCIGPGAPALPPCSGEACHGIPAATPALLAPASATFAGAGNLVSTPTKHLAKVKKKIKAGKHKKQRKKRGKPKKRSGKRARAKSVSSLGHRRNG
ncbi:MAG TPA: hypothetical protein VK781_03010, partial [Solirubrobacteraceae bacterium]|nr:hypothetical protein [Solirubrobacteraceae bacterium]